MNVFQGSFASSAYQSDFKAVLQKSSLIPKYLYYNVILVQTYFSYLSIMMYPILLFFFI